jgi:hypothetical protein
MDTDLDDVEVVRGLRVFDAVEQGDVLHVSIYGGATCVCGSVTFSYTSEHDRSADAALVRHWAREATPVTYVGNETRASLMDESDSITPG